MFVELFINFFNRIMGWAVIVPYGVVVRGGVKGQEFGR